MKMHTYLPRKAEQAIKKALNRPPVVAVLGPRQCGKSTLAKRYLASVDRIRDFDMRGKKETWNTRTPDSSRLTIQTCLVFYAGF